MAKSDTYKEIKIFRFPNMVARVHIPDITEEEKERRMKQIQRAAASLLLDYERGKSSCQQTKLKTKY